MDVNMRIILITAAVLVVAVMAFRKTKDIERKNRVDNYIIVVPLLVLALLVYLIRTLM